MEVSKFFAIPLISICVFIVRKFEVDRLTPLSITITIMNRQMKFIYIAVLPNFAQYDNWYLFFENLNEFTVIKC